MKPLSFRTALGLLALTACSSNNGTSTSPTDTTAQRTPMTAAPAPVQIHPVHHSAMVLQWNGLTIYVDPHDGAQRFTSYPAPDLVFITDIHGDHLDTATLNALKLDKAQLIVPQAVAEKLPGPLMKNTSVLANGGHMDTKGVGVEAIPMYNLPEKPDAFHPKGRGNGYVLTLGSQRIYISGDTQGIPEMRALKNIDIAFVCMNLPYTMTVDEAAGAVLDFKPRVVYPYHYRGTEGLSDVGRFKQLVNAKDPAIEVRLEDWYK